MKIRPWIYWWSTIAICFSGAGHAAWQQTAGPYGGVVYKLLVNGNAVFAGTNAGVFLSTDGGVHWSPINTGLGNLYVYSLFLSGRLGAGRHRTEWNASLHRPNGRRIKA